MAGDDEDHLPRIGSEPFGKPEDLPWPNHRCGHCRANTVLFDPEPSGWIPGVLEAGAEDRLRVLYKCAGCGERTLVIYRVAPKAEDNRANVVAVHGMYPPPAEAPLEVAEFTRSMIESYRDEAWVCYWSDHHRGAIVMARSALQAACRRYLPRGEWGMFAQEMDRLADKVGAGWSAIATKVKDFGNEVAHPDPVAAVEPSYEETKKSLNRMDDILRFTAAMEREGHLIALNVRDFANT